MPIALSLTIQNHCQIAEMSAGRDRDMPRDALPLLVVEDDGTEKLRPRMGFGSSPWRSDKTMTQSRCVESGNHTTCSPILWVTCSRRSFGGKGGGPFTSPVMGITCGRTLCYSVGLRTAQAKNSARRALRARKCGNAGGVARCAGAPPDAGGAARCAGAPRNSPH